MFNVVICTICGVYMQGMIIILPPTAPPPEEPPPEEAKIERVVDPKTNLFI